MSNEQEIIEHNGKLWRKIDRLLSSASDPSIIRRARTVGIDGVHLGYYYYMEIKTITIEVPIDAARSFGHTHGVRRDDCSSAGVISNLIHGAMPRAQTALEKWKADNRNTWDAMEARLYIDTPNMDFRDEFLIRALLPEDAAKELLGE